MFDHCDMIAVAGAGATAGLFRVKCNNPWCPRGALDIPHP